MATTRPTNRAGSAAGGYGNSVPDGGRNTGGLTSSNYATLKLLARVLVYLAIALFVCMSFLAFIETTWMKAEIKSEARQLHKLKREVETLIQIQKGITRERTPPTMDEQAETNR